MNLSAKDWIIAHSNEYGNRTEVMKACMKATGKSQSTVNEAMRRIESSSGVITTPQNSSHTSKVKSFAEFRSQHDARYKIEQMISKLPEEGYMTELDFRESSGVNATDFSRIRDEFCKYRVKTRDKVYWAKEKFANRMREVIEL